MTLGTFCRSCEKLMRETTLLEYEIITSRNHMIKFAKFYWNKVINNIYNLNKFTSFDIL